MLATCPGSAGWGRQLDAGGAGRGGPPPRSLDASTASGAHRYRQPWITDTDRERAAMAQTRKRYHHRTDRKLAACAVAVPSTSTPTRRGSGFVVLALLGSPGLV